MYKLRLQIKLSRIYIHIKWWFLRVFFCIFFFSSQNAYFYFYLEWGLNTVSKNTPQKCSEDLDFRFKFAVADLHSKILDAFPGQRFVIFMQFSAKFEQIIGWCSPFGVGAPSGKSWIHRWFAVAKFLRVDNCSCMYSTNEISDVSKVFLFCGVFLFGTVTVAVNELLLVIALQPIFQISTNISYLITLDLFRLIAH